MAKYGNKKTIMDGFCFDSKAEARRYQQLKLLEKVGDIFDLELQPKYTLVPKYTTRCGKVRRAITYTADFRYKVLLSRVKHAYKKDTEVSFTVVEDVKSPATAKNTTYIMKRNLFQYQNPNVDFREVLM